MVNRVSSPARLSDPEALKSLVEYFLAHGVLGYAQAASTYKRPSESQRLACVPLVFGLMPRAAFVRVKVEVPIKPDISARLTEVGIPATDPLVSIIKSVCDQY